MKVSLKQSIFSLALLGLVMGIASIGQADIVQNTVSQCSYNGVSQPCPADQVSNNNSVNIGAVDPNLVQSSPSPAPSFDVSNFDWSQYF